MSKQVTIYMPLLNEGTTVFRPIEANKLAGDIFLVLGPVPEDEEWEFQPGTKVQCVMTKFSGGGTGLVADKEVRNE